MVRLRPATAGKLGLQLRDGIHGAARLFPRPFSFRTSRRARSHDVQRQDGDIPRDHPAALPQTSACGFRKASVARLCAFQLPVALAISGTASMP